MSLTKLVVLLACAGCASDPADPVTVEVSQSAALLTHAGDSTRLSADGDVTWQSSNPDAVSVAADGTVTALVSVGSSQITASIGNTVSKPVLVVVAQPADNAVLVSDNQVLDGPTAIDPSVGIGARVHVTFSDTVAVAPGSIVLARESKPIAGRVVSADGGDVVLELVDMPALFRQLSVDSTYHIDQAVFDESMARAKPRLDFVEKKIGPFDCKISGSASAITGDASLKLQPDLIYAQRIRHNADGEVSSFTGVVNGSIVTTGSVSLKFTPTLGLGASCKVRLTEIPLPIGGPLSVIAGFQLGLGLRGEIAADLQTPAFESGFEIKQTSQVSVGFTYTPEAGLVSQIVPTVNYDGKLKFTMGHANNDSANARIAIGPTVALEAGVHFPLIGGQRLSLLEAFLSLRAEGQFSFPLVQLADPSAASKYEAKMAVAVGPGSDARTFLEFFGGFGSINPQVKVETTLARSPKGKLKATRPEVRVGDSIDLIVLLDEANLDFFGIRNVDEVRIYHASAHQEMELLATLPAGSVVTYEWKPAANDISRHTFWAVVTTTLAPGIPLEITEDSHVDVDVTAGTWQGNVTWSFNTNETEVDNGSTTTATLAASGVSLLVEDPVAQAVLRPTSETGSASETYVSSSTISGGGCTYDDTTTAIATSTGVVPAGEFDFSALIVNDATGTYELRFRAPPISMHEVTTYSRSLTSDSDDDCPELGTSEPDERDYFFTRNIPFIYGTFTPGASTITGTYSADGLTMDYTFTR